MTTCAPLSEVRRAGKEEVQEQCLDEVVEMVAEGNLGRADARRPAIQDPASQARAQ